MYVLTIIDSDAMRTVAGGDRGDLAMALPDVVYSRSTEEANNDATEKANYDTTC